MVQNVKCLVCEDVFPINKAHLHEIEGCRPPFDGDCRHEEFKIRVDTPVDHVCKLDWKRRTMEYEYANPDTSHDSVYCLGCGEEWSKENFADFVEKWGFFRQQFSDLLDKVYK